MSDTSPHPNNLRSLKIFIIFFYQATNISIIIIIITIILDIYFN